jgi:cholesterol 7-dehydrogenase
MSEVVDGQWQYGGRTENIVNCHLQEVPENGADIGHLNQIHAPSMVMGQSFQSWTRTAFMRFLFGLHEWQADWQQDQQESHLARIKLFQTFTLFGLKVICLDIDVTQVGPCLVLLRFKWPSMNITGVLSQAVMPVAANKQRIIHTIFMNQNVIGRLFSRLMLYGEINQVSH